MLSVNIFYVLCASPVSNPTLILQLHFLTELLLSLNPSTLQQYNLELTMGYPVSDCCSSDSVTRNHCQLNSASSLEQLMFFNKCLEYFIHLWEWLCDLERSNALFHFCCLLCPFDAFFCLRVCCSAFGFSGHNRTVNRTSNIKRCGSMLLSIHCTSPHCPTLTLSPSAPHVGLLSLNIRILVTSMLEVSIFR